VLVPLAARRVLGPLAQGIASAAAAAWTGLTNATCIGANMVVSADPGYGRSVAQIVGDGSASITITAAPPSGHFFLFGIDSGENQGNFTLWDYMFRLYGPAGSAEIVLWEDYSAVYSHGYPAWAIGDVWTYDISGGVLRLKKNGVTQYTSGKTPASLLYALAYGGFAGAEFSNLVVVP
jgi:hypothetical protein